MSKRGNLYSKTQKRAPSVSDVASSESDIHPNATLGPDASLESPTTKMWTTKDSTSAPEIGEKEIQEPYAKSHSELIDKYVMSRFDRKSIFFLIAILVIGYIFTQDNGAGKLSNWNDIRWFLLKSGIFLVLVLVLVLLISSIQWIYMKLCKLIKR